MAMNDVDDSSMQGCRRTRGRSWSVKRSSAARLTADVCIREMNRVNSGSGFDLMPAL